MPKIRRIEESLNGSLQSQMKLNKLSDVIRELVQNGVDANADNIKIHLKINFLDKNIELNYVDNGEGIDPNSLEDFGKRFFTSKLNNIIDVKPETCNNESDISQLKFVKTFGFRGEAINSLLHICSSFIITSRVKDYQNGFNVIFKGSERIGNIIKCNKLCSIGTQIKINGLFDPIIVRKKILFDNLENSWISENFDIRKAIIDSLLNKPFIKIEILKEEFKKNKWNKKIIIRNSGINKHLIIDKVPFQSQMNFFNFIFGGNLCEDYELCKVQYKDFKLITGIGLKTSQSKNYQFIYLNGRPFYNNELKKYINKLFQRNYELWGENLKDLNNNNMNATTTTTTTNNNKNKKSTSMYGRPYSINPIFVATFECPIELSDLLQDPSKVCYSTKNLKIMMKLFNKVIDVYFRIFKEQKDRNNKKLSKDYDKNEFINGNKRQKVINNYLNLKSNIRISKFKENELNGRLNDNKKNIEETDNKIYNINKITELLHKWDTEKQEKLFDNNNDHELDNEIGCNHSHGILSQEELKNQSIFFKKINKLELNRDDLKEFKLISQVDKKFILVKYRNRIICLDQHAICERIKLEKMYKELINQCFKRNNRNQINKYNELKEKIPISFMVDEIELIKKYKETLRFWGIEFDENFENIINLPLIILNKFSKIEFSVLKKGILEFIYNLHEKKKLDINKNIIANENFFWWIKYLSHMPEVYKEIIKSKACRPSIMFGDYISREEINVMLKELETCYQPFECAHGRPSLYPLCEI